MGVLVAVLACLPPRSDGPPLPASGRHRVQASGAAADALLAGGATLVADYGSFRILDATPAVLAGVPPDAAVEYRNEYLRLSLNSGDLDTSVPAPEAALRAGAVGAAGKALHLVQFPGPVRPDWLARLEATGARVVSYAPANGYLVYGDAAALERLGPLRAARELQFDAPYLPAHKLDRALAAPGGGSYAVQLVEDPAVNAETLALVRALERRPGTVTSALGYVNLVVHADRAAADALAARPDVVSVQPWSEPRPMDERQDLIVAGQLAGGLPTGPGYLAWLASKGFTQEQFDASGFGVDLSDSGVDAGSTLPNHFGLYRLGDVTGPSRVSYARLEGTASAASTLSGCDGHGNLNAHIVAGYSDLPGATHADEGGYRYGLGVAPFVRIGSSVVFDPRTWTNPDFEDLLSRAWADGMRISSNSWGQNVSSYGSDCQRYDALVRDAAPDGSAMPEAGNQEMVVVFAAGNAGAGGAGTIGAPGNAKNVISVGASENVRALGGVDRCGFADGLADAALDIAPFSSRGPSADGRVRPDLLAPGTHVTGGVPQAPEQRASPPASATGAQLACFAADSVCGGVGSAYFPAGQLWYTASSGTSHATPAVAGAAALVRQWFLNEGRPAPSPALTKAVLVNGARYMDGAGANDSLFSNAQGMGLVDLGAVLDGPPRLLRDQEPDDLFTASGQTRTFTSTVADPTRPFRVTLAWTDAPGATFAAAYKNDLDLTVEVGGVSYKGNVFAGARSAAGGAADARNNVESVFLPAGTSGPYTVTVTAASVNSDGVPGNATPLDQDFALVVGNGCATPVPAAPAGVTVTPTAESTLTVSWTAGTAADYLVYRSSGAGGALEHVATVAGPPFVDGGRSGGVTWSYVVRARQGCALSPPSPAVSAVATGPCLLRPAFAGLASVATTGDAVCGNALAWAPARPSCGGTVSYDVHRSPVAGFVPDPSTRVAAGIAATSFVDVGLVGGTTYHYAVRAVETTAQAAVEDANAVQRSAAPFAVSVPLRDDFDLNRPPSPQAWWIEQPLSGGDPLALVAGCRWHSSSTAYRFGQALAACGGTYGNSTQAQLVLGGDGGVSTAANGLAIPPGGRATLTFRLAYAFDNGFDGAYLAYSTAGASGPFTAIPDAPSAGSPHVVSGGYDGAIASLGNRRGWTGTVLPPNGALREVVVNLDALAGRTVWLAWRFGTDATGVLEGLHLDDVRLEIRDPACSSCATPPPAAPGGVSAAASAPNEVTVSWTPSGAGSYEVYRADAAGGPWTLAGAATAPPLVDGGRSGGSTYRYVVRARQGCALSAASAEAAVTATGACLLPPAFAGLAGAATTGAATCGNALSWSAATPSCGGTVSYEVFRSTAAGFAPGPSNRIATGVPGTGFVDTADLSGGTAYHYVVRAVEVAAATVSDANTVERTATPALVSVSFADDFDLVRPAGAAAWWSEQVLQGADQLQLVSGCRWQSAGTAYRFGQASAACLGSYPSSTVNQLVLGGDGTAGPNGFAIPADATGTLTFRLWYRLEGFFDGASLTYSTAGPAGPFAQVPDAPSTAAPYIVTGGYDQALASGARGWTGLTAGNLANGSLRQVVVNLDALAGQTVWFGWRIATDAGGVAAEGLYLDDVAVDARSSACTTAASQPGPAVRLALSGLPPTVVADEPVTVTLTALDAADRIATGYAGPALLASSDGAAVLPGPRSFGAGVASATVRFRTAGPQTLTATDVASAAIAGSATSSVEAGPTTRYAVSGPATVTAGTEVGYALQALDAFSNPAVSYAGTATATSDDPAATLPASVAFSGGQATAAVTFGSIGARTITFTEAGGTASGTFAVTVAPAAPAAGSATAGAGAGGGGGCGYGANASGGTVLLAALALALARRRGAPR